MSRTAIKIEGIGKKYQLGEREPYITLRDILSNPFYKKPKRKDFWALKKINLEIKQGDAVGLIGRNGSGKSTLLKILSRITHPTKGRITINGRVSSLLEVGTGFNPELTGRENIFLNGAILGMTRKEIRTKFDEIVEFSGVEKFIDTPVKRYSSGMYVRLAFAVAAHLESEIMLIDEVLAVGDAEFQQKCLGKMNSLAKSGRTVIFVSHNMGSITHLCNKAVLLDAGKVAYTGTAQDTIDFYLSSAKQEKTENLLTLKNREGKGDVKLVDVYWTNDKGERLSELRIGQKVKVHFKYTSKLKTLQNPEFGLMISDSIGRNLTQFQSNQSQKKFTSLPGKGEVNCTIEKLPLMTGKYYLRAGIIQMKSFEDLIDIPQPISVKHDVFFENGMHELDPKFQGLFVEQYWSRH